jgi:hypothetical protein
MIQQPLTTLSAGCLRCTRTRASGNAVQVAAVEDDALASGGVGIFVGGDYNQVALDHFAVRLPD